MDAQSIYEMSSVSRCLVFVMLSIESLSIDRPQRRSMSTARQAISCSPNIREETHRGIDLTEFLRFFAKSILAAVLTDNKIIS